MGIISVGIAASNLFGTPGALYGMMGHALAISLLFLIAGIVDEAYGTLEIGNLKRIIAQFPALAYLFIAGVFAALGLPLTAGFIGDLLIFIGSFKAFGLLGVAPLAGLFIAGAALFWTVERVFLGASEPTVPYGSVGRGIILQGAVLLAASIALGVLPFLLLGISKF
jgi:NADH-quinone oxidoreductase subunit M